jgi:hypothetical protein
VKLKRFLAADLVFILGISISSFGWLSRDSACHFGRSGGS